MQQRYFVKVLRPNAEDPGLSNIMSGHANKPSEDVHQKIYLTNIC
jgi:hypothetical protein